MNATEEFLNYQYKVIKKWGDSGEIYLAKDMISERLVIKKYIALSQIPLFEKIKQVHNENLVCILEVYQIDDRGVVIEEFIQGETMRERMERTGVMTEGESIGYLKVLCDVLERLHMEKIIHRDINLDNIMISKEGVLKLIDFHIARVRKNKSAKDTVLMGTVGYAAPEQYGLFESDVKTDVYALGVLFNVLLTGKFPYETVYEKNKVLRDIIQKCTHIDKEKRFQTTKELKKELEKREKGYYVRKFIREIPGFRSDAVVTKIVAFIGYPIVLLWMYFTGMLGVEMLNKPAPFWFQMIWQTFMTMIPFALLTNIGHLDIRLLKMGHIHKSIRVVIRCVLVCFSLLLGGLWMLLRFYPLGRY